MAALSFAKAFQVFSDKEYLVNSEKCMMFILSSFIKWDKDGRQIPVDKKNISEKSCLKTIINENTGARLNRSFFKGEAHLDANLDDYAYLIAALLELYEITFELAYLDIALKFNNYLIKHFYDKDNGGFYFTSDLSEKLIIRVKETFDGPYPSGNSIALLNLIKLAKITSDPILQRLSEETLNTLMPLIETNPLAYTGILCALDFATGLSYEIVICAKKSSRIKQKMIREIRRRYIPNKVLLFKAIDMPGNNYLADIAPFTKNMAAIGGKATAYICENNYCLKPVKSPEELGRLLDRKLV